MNILVNDGLHQKGIWMLEEAGMKVNQDSIPQVDLAQKLPDYDCIIVRSATEIRKELIDLCPDLRFIGRGGVGLDNIDVEHAEKKGILVYNTPAASSRSVAELVFGHIITIARGLHLTNRDMPQTGSRDFKQLKKTHSKGIELAGKTLGIIGLGRIGTESARMGVGMGMNVIGYDPFVKEKKIGIDINGQKVFTTIYSVELDELIMKSDVITLHVPHQKSPILGADEIENMKDGVILINASRGGVIDENALLDGLDKGKILGAGLDVFVGEPVPEQRILSHPAISFSPHIGAATYDAQEKISVELARRIIQWSEEQS